MTEDRAAYGAGEKTKKLKVGDILSPGLKVHRNNNLAAIHRARLEYCWSLAFTELRLLNDKKVNRILDKYSITSANGMLTGLFPKGLKKRDLPESLRLK